MRTLPLRRVCAVVYGTSTTSSWSCPPAFWPFAASTPTTVNGTLPIWICARPDRCPGKRFFATVAPSTATLRADAHVVVAEERTRLVVPVADRRDSRSTRR